MNPILYTAVLFAAIVALIAIALRFMSAVDNNELDEPQTVRGYLEKLKRLERDRNG